jgi:hypothetical protein
MPIVEDLEKALKAFPDEAPDAEVLTRLQTFLPR